MTISGRLQIALVPKSAVFLASLMLSPAYMFGAEQGFELRKIGTLPIPMMMHGSAYAESRLYIVGENMMGRGWTDRVWSAGITESGELLEWRSETTLPSRRAYISNSVTVCNGRIYVIGGSIYPSELAGDQDGMTATDYVSAEIGKNGILGPWRRTPAPAGLSVSCTVACTTGTRVFVLGGSTGSGYSNSVETGVAGSRGAPLQWKSAGKLPTALWFHGAGVDGDYLYAWGGLPSGTNTQVNDKCWRAKLSHDEIGEWEIFLTAPSPTYSAACATLPGYLISVAGRLSGGYPTNSIEYTRVPAPEATGWKTEPTELEGRLFSSTAASAERGCFYVSGGMDKRVSGLSPGMEFPIVDEVVLGTLSK